MISDILSPLVMGILLGGLYALIALGLSMVFGVMRLVNLAHGDLVILGSYLAYFIVTILLKDVPIINDPIVSLVICIPVMFGIGFYLLKNLFTTKTQRHEVNFFLSALVPSRQEFYFNQSPRTCSS